jgi:hypothetical protein
MSRIVAMRLSLGDMVSPYFRNMKSRHRLAPIKDFEDAENFSVSLIEQYLWKQLLDMTL